MSPTPAPKLVPKAPETLSERFWSLARGMPCDADESDPVAIVRHVLAVLDQLDAGAIGADVTVNTLSFLALLRQHEVRGDLLYASPEQIRGESMDERSLVFSVGVLLFEKLTGRHPFGAEGNPNRVARMRRGELASGVNFFPKVPAALRTVLVKAMGPFPEERFASLGELRARLEAYVGGHLDDGWQEPRARQRPRLPAVPERDSVWPAQLDEPTPRFGKRLARPRSLAPALWMAAGGALTALAFLLAWPSNSTAPAPATASATASAPAPKPAPLAEVAPAAAPRASAHAEPVTAPLAPTIEAVTAPTAEPATTPAAEPVTTEPAPGFDPELGGERALAAARDCFDPQRLIDGVELGATLIYDSADGLSRKVYFGNGGALAGTERRCLAQALIGIAAGAAPERDTRVVYSFFLTETGGRAKTRRAD